jgi:hypothetical protein
MSPSESPAVVGSDPVRGSPHGAGATSPLPPDLRARYPRLDSYLAQLPAGMESHPHCRVRVATYADVLLGGAEGQHTYAGVDPRVRAAIGEPPRGLWVPEVYLLAGMLAVGDEYRLTTEEHFEWVLEKNRALLRNGIYRAVMAFLTPDQLLRKASVRWNSFHQGTAVQFERLSTDSGALDLTFPPGLFDAAVAHAFGGVFVAAMERANATSVTLQVRECTATRVRYVAEWRR